MDQITARRLVCFQRLAVLCFRSCLARPAVASAGPPRRSLLQFIPRIVALTQEFVVQAAPRRSSSAPRPRAIVWSGDNERATARRRLRICWRWRCPSN
jgi:hypothetical protein